MITQFMGYTKIDKILEEWAGKHAFLFYKTYQGEDVRAVEKREGQRRIFQIWIDEPDKSGLIGVHVWNFKKKRRDFVISANDLDEYLENALKIAEAWSQ